MIFLHGMFFCTLNYAFDYVSFFSLDLVIPQQLVFSKNHGDLSQRTHSCIEDNF